MSIIINSTKYRSCTELVRQLGVTRQTLWRWRRDGKIPAGRRYRDGKILFNEAETAAIIEFAEKFVPVSNSNPSQLLLF